MQGPRIIAKSVQDSVCFGPASTDKLVMETNPFVTVCGSQIHLSSKVKYLGVCLSSHLSWHRQARSLTTKCYDAMLAISYLKGSFNLYVRRVLAQSLAMVHLDFCLVVRTSTMIQVAQNAWSDFWDTTPSGLSMPAWQDVGEMSWSPPSPHLPILSTFSPVFNSPCE